MQTAIREVVTGGYAESAHDLGEGGLAVALAECCAGGIGADIQFATSLRPELALFHEGPSRVLVSTNDPAAVERIAAKNKIEVVRLGVTMKGGLRIGDGSVTWIDSPVDRLKQVWENALAGQMTVVHA